MILIPPYNKAESKTEKNLDLLQTNTFAIRVVNDTRKKYFSMTRIKKYI